LREAFIGIAWLSVRGEKGTPRFWKNR